MKILQRKSKPIQLKNTQFHFESINLFNNFVTLNDGLFINLNEIMKNKPTNLSNLYFRFRINLPKSNLLISSYRSKNIFFESSLYNIEIFDFRMNEIRNLNKSLITESINKLIDINKIHLLIMKSSNDILTLNSNELKTARVLEKNLWNEYVDFNILDKTTIAYHWKIEKYEKYFNILARFKSPVKNCNLILKLIIFIFLIDLLFNFLANLINFKIFK